jgi:RND superfamily putative drug exporter
MMRLARIVTGRPRAVVAAWVLLLLAGASQASLLESRISNGGYTVSGSQSEQAAHVLERHIPRTGKSSLLVLIQAPSRSVGERTLAAVAGELTAHLVMHRTVAHVYPPEYSPALQDALLGVELRSTLGSAQKQMPAIQSIVDSVSRRGTTIRLAGEVPSFKAFSDIAVRDLKSAERFTTPLTIAILLLAFLSATAVGLPLLQAIFALVLSFCGLSILATFVPLSVFVSNTATLLGLALSIDYSLFLVTRYREERRRDPGDVKQAVERTIASAGRAILVSGLAVAAALSSLTVIGIGIFSSMALGAVMTAIIAASVALTLVPALIVLLGDRLDRLTFKRAAAAAQEGRLWHWLTPRVLRSPIVVAVVAIVGLGAVAIPAFHVRVTFPGPLSLPASSEVHATSSDIAANYAPGVLSPVIVASRETPERILDAASNEKEVAAVLSPRKGSDGWTAVVVALHHVSGEAAAENGVRELRARLPGESDQRTFVGGETGNGLDIADRVHSRFPTMILVAVLLSLLVLVPAYRSLVVPIQAAISSLLSVGATLGLLTLGLRWFGHNHALAYFVPPFLFAITFALALDYEVFLLSRIREEYIDGADNKAAVARGLTSSARAITLAATVMVSVFIAFTFSSLEAFRELGFGLSLAVLIDATLVRMLLVPAVLQLLGDRNWWWGAGRKTWVALRGPAAGPLYSEDTA